MTDHNDEQRPLNLEQYQRAAALRVARRTLASGGGPLTGGSVERYDVPDLIDVAAYVMTGAHPFDRQTEEPA